MAIGFRAIAQKPVKFRSSALLLISVCTLFELLSIRPAVATRNDDFGPYLEVYPPVNFSQNQFECIPQAARGRTCPLYIALTQSFGKEYDSSGVVPAVQYALDQINADTDLLPGYSLHYTLTDSQVSFNTTNMPQSELYELLVSRARPFHGGWPARLMNCEVRINIMNKSSYVRQIIKL